MTGAGHIPLITIMIIQEGDINYLIYNNYIYAYIANLRPTQKGLMSHNNYNRLIRKNISEIALESNLT